MLRSRPRLHLITQITAGDHKRHEEASLVAHMRRTQLLQVLEDAKVVRQVRGQDQFPQVVDALLELGIAQPVQDLALAIVEDANGLRQVVALVDAALAAVQLGQGTLGLHLI